MARRIRLLAAWLVALGACSDSKPKPEPAPAPPPAAAAASATPKAKASGTALADGPRTVERVEPESIVRRGEDGQKRTWNAVAGIEISGVDYKELYKSRGEHFVSFKTTIKGGPSNCLVYWNAEFLGANSGRATSLRKLEGTVPVAAGETVVASGVANLSTTIASTIDSASVGYWTLCGEALPSPSVFDVAITETEPEQIKYGKSFNLHHTRLAFEAHPSDAETKSRCYFDMVVEDVDREGFTLNRDFASFSMVPGTTSSAKLRRTTFEGGHERDYTDLAMSKRSYLRKLVCTNKPPEAAPDIEGLRITNLALEPYDGEPATAEQHVRATYGHRASLENTSEMDCSFRVRYRILDRAGLPINRGPLLSETLHLKKGARATYRSKSQRLFVWKEQAADVGTLIVEHAAPVQGCAAFDASKALEAGDETIGRGGNEHEE